MEKGILLGKFDYTDAFYGNAYSGGQVYTYNSAFNDNLVSISAMSYTNPNPLPTIFGYSQSRVNQCSFTNKTRTNFGMHIFLYDVKGFQVMGCSFNNLLSTSNSYNSTQRGAGVVGWNAIAEILNYRDQISNVYVKNRFSNLTYGVYFSNNAVVGDATRNLKITQCSFKGNTYGIYLNGVKYPAVVNDSIDVPILPGTLSGTPPLTYYSSTKSYGIYLNGCSDYKVQNDTVKSAAVTIGSISTGVSYGIVVNNGSSLPTMIRRNQIVQTNYGLTAVGNNGSSASGLLFQCNTLKNNTKYDIWLAENTVNGTTTTGTIRDQGALSSTPNATTFASDNQFYQLSSSYPQYQLMRNAQTNSYTYFYYQFDLTKIPARISNTNPILLNQFGVTSNCSDNVIPDDYTPVSALKIPIEVTSIRKTLKQDEEYYLAKLEEGGGSFQEIVDSITARPYVSMDVLHKVLVHPIANTCLPSVLAMVQQHSGSDDSIAYYLAKAHLPFSKSVLTELQKHLQVKSSSQYSAVMRANVLEAQLEAMIINQAIKYVDSGDVEHALRFLEASCYSPNLHYFWAEMAMQYGSLQLQQRVIDTLLHYPSEHLNHRLGEYYTLLNSSQVRKNSRKSVDTAPLYVLYKNGDAVSSKAAALLGQLTDTLLAPYLPDPDLDLERDANVKDYWLEIPTTNSIYLLVTPNPADNAVSVFYQIPNAKEVILEVLDMQGKLIFSRTTNEAEGKININSSQWESGSYFIKVLDANSNEFKSDKLTIIH